jgi:hypothetical protein
MPAGKIERISRTGPPVDGLSSAPHAGMDIPPIQESGHACRLAREVGAGHNRPFFTVLLTLVLSGFF